MPLAIASARKLLVLLLPVAGSSTISDSGATVVVGCNVVSTATVVVVGAAVVVGASVVVGAMVVVGASVVVGARVVVEAVVVVVVGASVVVVVGFAVHWAYNVKSAVWLCAALLVISVPPDAAVNQPANE